MGNPTIYTDEDGNAPTTPENGWQEGSLYSEHGEFLVDLLVKGVVELVSSINRKCITFIAIRIHLTVDFII